MYAQTFTRSALASTCVRTNLSCCGLVSNFFKIYDLFLFFTIIAGILKPNIYLKSFFETVCLFSFNYNFLRINYHCFCSVWFSTTVPAWGMVTLILLTSLVSVIRVSYEGLRHRVLTNRVRLTAGMTGLTFLHANTYVCI